MNNPITNKIGTVFIPVSNIERARDWYCNLLGVESNGEILFDHLYVLPMQGTGIVLDSKIFTSENIIKTPLFHLNTDDIEAAFDFIKQKQIEMVTPIQHGHYFHFKDPDGNALMVCRC
ncbi:VOC family protein [Niallia taxi]|uniref:VOC family protein n=1 Tax=Niallia taxi TaxID=2499688 RepID=UPI001244FEA8|nr:VOC family protein [Niallia taxi]MCM3213944.1 VOC family protein [Niallia taxi]MDK8642064.1 VOC family protein [Niallia taxi]MED4039653.1 VOC family protein [Niallia taxi]